MDDEARSTTTTDVPIKTLTEPQQRQIIGRLWRRMAALYGERRWLEHAPLTIRDPKTDEIVRRGVDPDWLDVLGDRSMTDIARGIQRLTANPGKHPPGAGEFRAQCREFQSGTFAGASRPLPSVVKALASATSVTGSTRAYLAMCNQIAHDQQLTRAELEHLPSIAGNGGVYRPADLCSASDDVPEVIELPDDSEVSS